MRQLPEDWSRCRPTKCKHGKETCARFLATIGKDQSAQDFSKYSTGQKCAGYEPNN